MSTQNKKRTYWIIIYILATLAFLLISFAADKGFLDSLEIFESAQENLVPIIQKWAFALAVISIILLIRTTLEKLIDRMDQSRGEKYNLLRITRLVATILIIYVTISSFFINPYKSLAGLGLASLVLGFALQAPITSFISWLYIVFRKPYQVGDRIQISDHRGDVIEISYLDTIIEECSGDYIENDQRSGRLIHFPNSKILTDRIINYSGPIVPFIWNETAIQVTFTSDLQYIEECLLQVAEQDFKEMYPHKAELNAEKWKAKVYFRVSQRAWLEAVISYPVSPKDTTGKRNRILKNALPLLNTAPDKVQYPVGNTRLRS